jgi:lipoprotein-anchoring transpeptidase ErfK/SrfK
MRWFSSVLAVVAVVGAVQLGTAEPAVAAVSQQSALQQSAAARVAGTPCTSAARACVDLSSNRAWLIRDGRVSYGPVPVSHGRRGHRTPPGTFRVTFRDIDHVSSIYGTPMPYSVFFNGGIAFHQGDIGGQSAGCVRMQRSAAREFYTSLRRGDVVQVVR